MYRRFRAMRSAPDVMMKVGRADGVDGFITIVCSVNDSLVLYDGARKRLVGFPRGWVFPINVGRDAHCVVTGIDTISIVHVQSEEMVTQIKCISIDNGSEKSLVHLSTPVSANVEFSRGRTRRTVIALSAGRNGDHLVFVRNGTVTVVRLSDGSVVRRWVLRGDDRSCNTPHDDFGWLVRGEDCGWCGGEADGAERIVGILQLKGTDEQGQKQFEVVDIVSGNVLWEFSVDKRERLVDVVISRDEKWIGRRLVKESRRAVIWGSGSGNNQTLCDTRNDVGWAGGSFGVASCEFALGRGGREMRYTPIGLREVAGVEGDGWIRRVWCDVMGTRIGTLKGIRRVRGRAFDWAMISGDGKMLLASCRSVGVVSIFDLERGDCVRSLHCGESIDELCLIGHHWLVAIDASGCVRMWHFGRWCDRKEEVVSTRCFSDRDQACCDFSKCHYLFRHWDSLFPPS